MLCVIAEELPLLIVFEDIHWADPASLELLAELIDRTRNVPIMVIATMRPEGFPPWVGKPNVTTLILKQLDRYLSAEMVSSLDTSDLLPFSMRQMIVEKSNGIPLRIEEMTRAALSDSGLNISPAKSTGFV